MAPRSSTSVLFSLAALGSCQAVSSPPSAPQPSRTEQTLSLYVGARNLGDDEFWVPNEHQVGGALEYAREDLTDVVGWELGLAGSGDKSSDGAGNEWTGSTGEIYGGVRKSWGDGSIRPYVGAGLSYIEARWELAGQRDDDNSFAGYVHGGMQWLLGPSFCLGIDLRALFGSSVSLGQHTVGFDMPGDADYLQAALSFGWRF